MAAANRIDDNDSTPAIGSSLKIELKPNSAESRASSPSGLIPSSLKSYQNSQRTAKLLHPPSSVKPKAKASQIKDEIISELLGTDARIPEYAPEPDKNAIGQSPAPEQPVEDKVSIESKKPAPKLAPKPVARSRVRAQPVRRTKAPAVDHALILYYFSLNMIFSTAIFFVLYFIMQIPGTTSTNQLSFYEGLQIDMPPMPLWLNSGFIIVAVIFMVRILLYHGKYGLGLVIGIPVGLNTVLSLYIEGFVGNGIAFALIVSTLSLLFLIIGGRVRLRPEDTTLISMVAGLSTIPIIGHVIHFFAGLLIGLAVVIFSQIVLLIYVMLRRHR